MKESWQNFSFGVVTTLIGILIYLSFLWFPNNPEISYFTLGSVIVLLIFMIEVYFSKKTDKKLTKIQDDLAHIKEQLNKINKNGFC